MKPAPDGAAPALGPATTVADATRLLRRRFAEGGLDSPALDARLLVTEAARIEPSVLLLRPDLPLGDAAARRLAEFARRRLAREPIARILGTREFWGLPFSLTPETLVPRPETETVIETALALSPERAARRRVLDLGTGSGCLLVALLSELPRAWGLGLDRSPGALRAAQGNARRNGVGDRAAFLAGDWAAPLAGRFDLVVSNPPYIASGVIPTLDPEVRDHDPSAALDGGGDGLQDYRVILGEARRLLAPGGLLVLEIGHDQAESVAAIGRESGLVLRQESSDLAGRPRALAFAEP